MRYPLNEKYSKEVVVFDESKGKVTYDRRNNPRTPFYALTYKSGWGEEGWVYIDFLMKNTKHPETSQKLQSISEKLTKLSTEKDRNQAQLDSIKQQNSILSDRILFLDNNNSQTQGQMDQRIKELTEKLTDINSVILKLEKDQTDKKNQQQSNVNLLKENLSYIKSLNSMLDLLDYKDGTLIKTFKTNVAEIHKIVSNQL